MICDSLRSFLACLVLLAGPALCLGTHARQLHGNRDALVADGEVNLDDLANATLARRYNKPAKGREWSNWVALGESYAAGPGAGDGYGDGGGVRRQGAYPAQLDAFGPFRDGHGSPEFRFAACSGSSTTKDGCGDGVLGQIDSVDSGTGLVTLSVGGNDGGVFGSPRDNPCFGSTQQDYFDDINNQLFAPEFHDNFFTMAERVIGNLQWSEDRGTVVYQTGYPQFFDDYNTQCSSISFGPDPSTPRDACGKTLICVDTTLRKNFNFLLQQMNCLEAYWIDQINHDHGDADSGTDIWKHSNMDQRFNGHRFCRDGVEEPDRNNPDTWFFNLYSNSESGGASAFSQGDNGESGTAEQYADVDAGTCDPVASGEGEDEWTMPVRCMMAKALADGYDGPLPDSSGPDSTGKIFHPRIAGHGQTKEEVTQAVQYAHGASPSGKTLGILSIGDGLTLGVRSSEGSGYRKPLFDRLQGNDVELVGTQSSGEAGSKWEKCEGYRGYHVADINYELIHGSANGLDPNVIVIMAGTNDVNQTPSWAELEESRNQIEGLITLARIIAPEAFIIVAHVPAIAIANFDAQISDVQRRVIQWNANLNMIVNRERTVHPDHPILYAHTTPTTFDHVDGDGADVYPNNHGYDRLADDIAEAIAVGDSFGWITDPTATAEAGDIADYQGMCTAANECSIVEPQQTCFNNYQCAPEKGGTACSCWIRVEAAQGENGTCAVPAGCTNAAAPDGCAVLCG